MASFRLRSASEQVAAHLRGELAGGRWRGTMPGVYRLVEELGVSRKTVEAALRQLEREGLLVPQGPGRRRRIAQAEGREGGIRRVRVLLYEQEDRGLAENMQLLARLQEAGFDAGYAAKSQHDLRMDVTRVARFVERHPADVWIINSGSREILEWFASRPVPSLALFGRFLDLSIAAASPRKIPALVTAVRHLAELGHRRVVMVVRQERREPVPAKFEQVFLDELEACGIETGPYNLPDWDENLPGLHRFLSDIFRFTPPTALIFDEAELFLAARLHLADRGIVSPRDVSMICCDQEQLFSWCEPAVSHIRWDRRPVVDRVVRWVMAVAKGRNDRRQVFAEAEFVEGGTVGPVSHRQS